MEILYLGGLFPKETEEEIINNSIGSIQNAANNLQWEIAKGLEENMESPISLLNSLYIGSYPKRYKKLLVRTYNFSDNLDISHGKNIGFLNVCGIKSISRYLSLKPYIRDWIKSNRGKKKVIIAYAMTSTFTQILEYAKKIDTTIITCLIIPDLPQFMNLSVQKKHLYTFFKNIEISIINKNMKYIDSYVVLTKYMLENLKITKPAVIVEGISTDIFTKSRDYKAEKYNYIKTVVYTGGLNRKYGILDLVESFQKLDNKNYRLIICGSGDSEKEILEASNKDNRILFKGLLKREEILKFQRQATILVNPRKNNEEYTKYSFPSKILEYMSSGRPVVAYMLDGMPKEYLEYIYVIDRKKENAIYYALKETMERSEEELDLKGNRAREFVLDKKNRRIQCEKILTMIKSI